MKHLKAVGEKPEPSGSEFIEEDNKDDEGKPTGTTNQACQRFKCKGAGLLVMVSV